MEGGGSVNKKTGFGLNAGASLNKDQHLAELGNGSLLFRSLPVFTKSMSEKSFLVCFPREIKLMQSCSVPMFRPLFEFIRQLEPVLTEICVSGKLRI